MSDNPQPIVAAGDSSASEQLYQAVKYCLDRVQTNPDLGYYAGFGTETFHLLTVAEAAYLHQPLDAVERHRKRTFWRGEPRVRELQRELDALRG